MIYSLGKKGGEILSSIHAYVDHGDASLNNYTQKLISRISEPFYNTISSWIYQGDVEDPFGEFFVSTTGAAQDEDNWGSKYTFDESMVPSFIQISLAKKVFFSMTDSLGIFDWKIVEFYS